MKHKPSWLRSLTNRVINTADVCVSKIFPAGFGWQTASVYAGAAGFSPLSLEFACMTGVGDALGVALGHTTFCLIKKAFGAKNIVRANGSVHALKR